jgi:hypothetical protein
MRERSGSACGLAFVFLKRSIALRGVSIMLLNFAVGVVHHDLVGTDLLRTRHHSASTRHRVACGRTASHTAELALFVAAVTNGGRTRANRHSTTQYHRKQQGTPFAPFCGA